MARTYAALFAFVVIVLAADAALAEHEVYYRYVVLGYVKDAGGQLRAGIEVQLVRDKTGFSYLGRTDATGLYVIVARLGDESLGESLSVRAAGLSAVVVARFDPTDHVHERGTRVDFVGGKSEETPTAFHATLRRFLAE